MKLSKIMFALSAVALLVGLTWAADPDLGPWHFFSEIDEPLDTRSMATTLANDAEALETRSYTVDWSAYSALNTKKIIGTMFLIR